MGRTTVLSLLVFASAAVGQNTPERNAAVKYVQDLQQPDGSFLPAAGAPKQQGGLRATSGAIRALKYLGGEARDRAAAAKFVQSCFDATSGGFSERPGGKPDVFSTAVGLMAVAELRFPTDIYTDAGVKFLARNAKGFDDVRIAVAGMEAVQKFPDVVGEWHKEVLKRGNGDGTWGKDDRARATGSTVALLLRSGYTLEEGGRKNALEALRRGQQTDGGFGKGGTAPSDLETTYRVMRAFHLLKEKPADVAKLRAFIATCRNADGGYGVEPGKPSTLGGTYYAAIIEHWLGK